MAFDGLHGWMLGDPVDGRFQVYATKNGGRHWKLSRKGPRRQPVRLHLLPAAAALLPMELTCSLLPAAEPSGRRPKTLNCRSSAVARRRVSTCARRRAVIGKELTHTWIRQAGHMGFFDRIEREPARDCRRRLQAGKGARPVLQLGEGLVYFTHKEKVVEGAERRDANTTTRPWRTFHGSSTLEPQLSRKTAPSGYRSGSRAWTTICPVFLRALPEWMCGTGGSGAQFLTPATTPLISPATSAGPAAMRAGSPASKLPPTDYFASLAGAGPPSVGRYCGGLARLGRLLERVGEASSSRFAVGPAHEGQAQRQAMRCRPSAR